jgi:hypothetical protein
MSLETEPAASFCDVDECQQESDKSVARDMSRTSRLRFWYYQILVIYWGVCSPRQYT